MDRSGRPSRDPEHHCLTSRTWFPLPSSPEDIQILTPTDPGVDAEWLCELLLSPEALEWRDKVGVAGPRDGSAKSSTRLLSSRGWILKTNIDLGRTKSDEVTAGLRRAKDLAIHSTFWHPRKVWAAYESLGVFYPLNATPELRTLRQIESVTERMEAWTGMLELGVEVAVRHGIGLDLNPSNFGRESGATQIYYLDDEWYPAFHFNQFAGAVVGRIPEEISVPEAAWESWGRALFAVLKPLCPTPGTWGEFLDRLMTYPLAECHHGRRTAVLEGLRRELRAQTRSRSSKQPSDTPARTAIVADVHGNLAALETVLQECRTLGVDSYLFLGDVVGYGPQPLECIQRLAELPNAQYVRGNHDDVIGSGVLYDGMNSEARLLAEWTLARLGPDERRWLSGLPVEQRGEDWLAVHGAPRDQRRFRAYVYELTYEDNLKHLEDHGLRLCFCGHTHVQFVYEQSHGGATRKLGAPREVKVDKDHILIVNPGSVGQPRDGDPRAGFAIWSRTENIISLGRVEYPIEKTERALAEAGLPGTLAQRLRDGL